MKAFLSSFKTTLFSLFFLLIAAAGWAQVIIAADGFNNSLTLFSTSGAGTFYNGTSTNSDRPSLSPYFIEGTHSFGVTNGTTTLTSTSNVNTSGYTNVAMTLRLASFSVGSIGNGADTNDLVSVEVSPDGGANYYKTIEISGDGNNYWSYSGGTAVGSTPYDGNITPVNFTGTTTLGLSTVKITNLPATSNLKFKITLLNNANSERWVIDDFKVTGTLAGPTLTATPTALTDMTYVAGSGPSNVKNFALTGVNLNGTQDVEVLPGNNWEVSTNQTTWFTYATPLVLSNYDGSLTTVYVRLKSGLPAATYNNASNDIIITEGYGITPTSNVTLSGTVTAPLPVPVVTGDVLFGSVGTPLNFQVQATNAPTSFALATGSTLPAGLTLSTTGLISGTPTTFVDEFSTSITATNSTGTSDAADFLISIEKGSQTITFTAPTAKQYGDANFNLSATASSGLAVSYTSSDTSVATVSGNEVTIIGVGTTNITASQTGEANYIAAADVTQPFAVTKRDVTITGITANNKVEDGDTLTTLSGTAVLNGVIAADAGQVSLGGIPIGNFQDALIGTGKTVTVSGYELTGAKVANYSIIQPTGLTADITALGTPVATAATEIGTNSFVANWDSVTDASNYRLDVYTGSSAPGVTITEDFSNIGKSSTAYNTVIWIGVDGVNWNAYKARTDQVVTLNNQAIALRDQAGAYLESDVISNGITNVSFDVMQVFGGSGGILTIKVLTGTNFTTESFADTYSYTTTASTYNSGLISGVSGDYKIRIDNNASARAAIDNLSFTSAPVSTISYVPSYEDLSVGNLTSHLVSGLTPATQYFYRVRAENGSVTSPNSNVISVTTKHDTTTYNGSTENAWDFGLPTAEINAVINGAYVTEGNLVSKTLTINAGNTLTIAENTSFTLGNFTNNGTLVVESDGNFVQTEGSTNTGAGSATVKRNATMKRLDYTYWGSPVSGQMLKAFSPNTVNSRFLTYNESDDTFTAVGSPATTAFAPGKGYAIRADNTYPAWTDMASAVYTNFIGSFTGKPNNGDVPFTLEKSGLGQGFNLVANPYASNIDLDDLLETGVIEGTVYFWSNVNKNISGTTYEANNYANYAKLSGGTVATNGTKKPERYIKVGQGFIVQAKQTGTLTFTNAMRDDGTGASIFMNKGTSVNNAPIDRFWLKLTTPAQNFNTLLIAYPQGATNGFESSADAQQFRESSDSFYTILNDFKLNIQGRQFPLVKTDVVQVGMKGFEGGNYTISMVEQEGVFAETQMVYLKDNQTNTITNLSVENYSFAANEGLTEGRFEIVYENEIVLGAGSTKKDELIVYRDGTDFIIKSIAKKVTEVEVYDTSGRLVSKFNPNQTEIKIDGSTMINGVYILKINRNGELNTKKITK